MCSIFGDQQFTIPFVVTRDWKCKWPLPAKSMNDICLDLPMQGGELDITRLLDVDTPMVVDWFEGDLEEYVRTDADSGWSYFKVWEGLSKVLTKSRYLPIMSQILYHFAMRVERFLGKCLQSGKCEGPFLRAATWDVDGEDMVGDEADMYVARYVHASVEELRSKTEFCLATDKGVVNKLPLQDTLIGTANTVVLSCPNVNAISRDTYNINRTSVSGFVDSCGFWTVGGLRFYGFKV